MPAPIDAIRHQQQPGDSHLVTGRLLTPEGPRWGRLHIERGVVAAVDLGGDLEHSPDSVAFPEDVVIAPGFVDMHVHGGAGLTFGAAATDDGDLAAEQTRADARAIAAFHRAHGTTTLAASLVSAPLPLLERQLRFLSTLEHRGELAGLHLEGPFLSPRHCGAHQPAALQVPTPRSVEALLTAADGALCYVTIAPELPGALDAITRFVAAGVLVGIGHTAASEEQVNTAIDAGAQLFTHLFNGMPPLHHRAGGPVLAAQLRTETTVELIADGVHLAAGVVRWQFASLGADRIALVTDATAAAGQPDGHFRLGGVDVVVQDGRAWSSENSSLAGSTATMGDVVRFCRSIGVPLDDVVTAATRTPAHAFGLDDVGALAPRRRADLVVLRDDGTRLATMTGGEWMS